MVQNSKLLEARNVSPQAGAWAQSMCNLMYCIFFYVELNLHYVYIYKIS